MVRLHGHFQAIVYGGVALFLFFVCTPCLCPTLSTISSSLQHLAVLVGVQHCWSEEAGGVVDRSDSVMSLSR